MTKSEVFSFLSRSSIVLYNNCDTIALDKFERYLSKRVFGDESKVVAARMFYLSLDGKRENLTKVKELLEEFSKKHVPNMSHVVFVTNYNSFHVNFYDLLLKLVEEKKFIFMFSVKFGTKLPDPIVSRSFIFEWMYSKEEIEKASKSEISVEEYLMTHYVEVDVRRSQRFKEIDNLVGNGNKKELFNTIEDRYDLMFLVFKLIKLTNSKVEIMKSILENRYFLTNTFKSSVLLAVDQI